MLYAALPEPLVNKLREFSREFTAVEQALKQQELIGLEGLIFPALNEIRYAGSHLSRALADDQLDSALVDLDTAIKHLHRSFYDAHDGAIWFALESCQSFRNDYRRVSKTQVLPNYVEDLQTVEKIRQDVILEARNNDRREEYIERKGSQLAALQAICQKWDSARDELNLADYKDRYKNFLVWVGIGVSLVIGLLALIF